MEGEFSFAKWSDADNPEEIQIFLDESVKDGCEGLMVKMLEGKEAYYEPSRRSINWLKVRNFLTSQACLEQKLAVYANAPPILG